MNRTVLANAGLFAAQILASVIGLVVAKQWLPRLHDAWTQGRSLFDPLAMVGLGASLYALSFALWLLILSRIDLTIAYPVAVAMTMLLTACGAVLFLGETMTLLKTTGMLLVCIGVVCLVMR